MPESVREKLERLRQESEASPNGASSSTQPTHDPDLIPAIDPSTYQPTEEDSEIERLLEGLDILDAYRRWCGKMNPEPGGKRESIMISCPRPDHPDKTPSAWVNLDKQTWYCGRCDDGGDALTLVARTKGLDGDSYQQGKAFPDLKREMAQDMGYIVRKTLGGQVYVEQVEDDPERTTDDPGSDRTSLSGDRAKNPPESPKMSDLPDTEPISLVPPIPEPIEIPKSSLEEQVSEPEPVLPSGRMRLVTPIFGEVDDKPEIPEINWRDIVPPDTFLHEWMSVMENDDLPVEFYFWHGLVAVGMAAGRDTVLSDRQPVLGNLYLCLYGPSGQGKSRSTAHLTKLLRDALPYEMSDPEHTGAHLVPAPGSPEALIDSFSRPVYDDTDPKVIDHYGQVRGLIRFDELATLIGRATRTGNPLKPILQSFYDGDPYISTSSRGHGVVEAHNSFAAAVTTTQPRAIRQVLLATDVDSGFANRWVYVMGHSKPPIPIGGDDLDTAAAIDKLKQLHAWAGFKWNLKMTVDAKLAWGDFYMEELAQCHSTDDALMSRIPLLMKKLVLLLAVNKKEIEVSLGTIESVIKLYPYVRATYEYLSGDLGTGERGEAEQLVIKAIKTYQDAHGGAPPSPRHILRHLSSKVRPDAGSLRRTLEDLTAVGLIEEVIHKPTTGRPTVKYAVKEA